MEHLLLVIIGILLLIIFVLLAKVYFLRKSAQEIAENAITTHKRQMANQCTFLILIAHILSDVY